jgi:hypothetical protein
MARLSFHRRLERKLPRVAKATRQWVRALAAGARPQTRVVFVVGAQRSGTRLPLEVFDQSPQISTFSEGTDPFFDGVLLRPLPRVEALIHRSASPVIALKPICETHRTNELLDRFPASRAVWIFRHFEDTVNSATLKWNSGRAVVRRLARREFGEREWRAGGLTEEKLRLAASVYHEGMSEHEANAFMWYLRNALFFELRANERNDVLLVRYEDLVAEPHEYFARIFAFIGVPVPIGALAAIRRSARPSRPFPHIAPAIRQLCEDTHRRLLAHYSRQRRAAAPASASVIPPPVPLIDAGVLPQASRQR